MRLKKRIAIGLLLCLLLVQFLPVSMASAAQIEAEKSCKILISYQYDSQPLAEAEFAVYRVGDVHEDGSFNLTGEYAKYPLDPQDLTVGVSDLSQLLYSYVLLNQQRPNAVLTTNARGEASAVVSRGLYLIAGEKYENDKGVYTSEPILMALPYRFSQKDPWQYEMQMLPKCKFVPEDDEETTSLSVMKVWEDQNSPDRPASVEVSLLKDGVVAEKVQLSDANRWTYKWENLSVSSQWRVVETPVKGYLVREKLVTGIYVITNTLPDASSTEPTTPTEPSETTPTEPEKPKLPQTGQLWWPVPILVVMGFMLILGGIRMMRGERDET